LAGAADGEAGLAYRLLQLALVFIFTLRNANRIPEGPGEAWGISEQSVIPAIMQMRKGQESRMRRWLSRAAPISPSFRDHSLRIAVVSICAYPPNHTLALTKVTPANRDAYAQRHGYALRLHLEPPVIGAHGLGLQHAKLATVLSYLQAGDFDWVAWLDCDSIIMNMDRTLDSIIYQYAQRVDPPGEEMSAPICGAAAPGPEDGSEIDLSGDWLDSWVPADLQEAAPVRLRHLRPPQGGAGDDGDGVAIEASAEQFGSAAGRLRGAELELDFPGGTLRGSVSARGDVHDGASRVEWENGAVWRRRNAAACRDPCRRLGPDECRVELDPDVNLLITEEAWGLSSANWLIRRSAWSIDFLHAALNSAHVELQLFGDQDAMILNLMNRQALEAAATGAGSRGGGLGADPLDRHAVVVPQFELNAYDALNSLTMDCDCFVEGDLLVTFPQCKDPEGCNDVFNLAAEYAGDPEAPREPDAGAWWRRFEGPPAWPNYDPNSAASLRVFGPREVIREVFLREQSRSRE